MTVAQLIKELEKYPPDKKIYVDHMRNVGGDTGAFTEEEDPVIYDMDTYLRIAS
jgi:hypothetical protein